jgi:Eukaryotic protein of unknown function (DUF842)
MTTPAGQAKAQALNAKLEGAAHVALDEIDRVYVRKGAREFHACAIRCYDGPHGKTGTPDALQNCVSICELPHRQASALVQQVRFISFCVLLSLSVVSSTLRSFCYCVYCCVRSAPDCSLVFCDDFLI